MKICNGLGYWGQLLLLPIYWLSFLVPRDKKLWLFGSTFGRRFADNPKYLYLYMSQHREELGIRPVWISHDRGIVEFLRGAGAGEVEYEAYYYHSLKGIWLALRGKVYLFDNYSKDINFWQSGGAVKVNLWHGVGNKQINYDNVHDRVRHPRNVWERIRFFPRRLSDEKPGHYVLATSPVMSKIFARAFRVPRNHVIEAGYPRNDFLLGEDIRNIYTLDEKKVLEIIHRYRDGGAKMILYLPTFRETEKKFTEIMVLDKFNAFLKEENIFFMAKLHPKSRLKKVFTQFDYSNIVNLDADLDPYIFLRYVDILITDYSSVYSDFMLLDKPVVAFQYDYNEYLEQTRDGYFDFRTYMPEIQAHDMEELMEGIKEVLDKDIAKEARAVSRAKMFSDLKADGCKNICDRCMALVGVQKAIGSVSAVLEKERDNGVT